MPSAIDLATGYPSFGASLAVHILIGTAAMLFYWRAAASTKGSPAHKSAGRRFSMLMLLVGVSVGPLLFLAPGAFDPAHVIQFSFLVLCLFTVVLIAWSSIRWKSDIARFRGRHFLTLGTLTTAFSAVVLCAGVAETSVLTVSFSLIGFAYGPAMVRFARLKTPPHPRWWLSWHLNAVCGLFNAVHANFLAVVYEHFFDPTIGDAAILATNLGTGVIALVARIWLGNRYSAPLRFSHRPQALGGSAAGIG